MALYNDDTLTYLLQQEIVRQKDGITLIASENVAYPDVLTLTGSLLTNKYAEGYPTKRYYAGCKWVDEIEELAINRAQELFKAEHANVQPHSGSAANMAVLMAVLKPGDTLMGMSLASGGHLTHGHSVSFSGMLFNSVSYDVDPQTFMLDYDAIEELAYKHKPKLIIAGGSSYSRIIDVEKFSKIAKAIHAYLLIDCAHTAGLIAAGLYPHPFPYADFVTGTTHKTLRGPRGGFIVCKKEFAQIIDRAVFPLLQGGPFMNVIAAKAYTFKRALKEEFTAYQKQAIANAQMLINTFKKEGYSIISGGSDTHLFVIDLRPHNLTGITTEKALEEHAIYVSRSALPFDTEKPFITSGIRLGTLAITSNGYDEKQSENLAYKIINILNSIAIKGN